MDMHEPPESLASASPAADTDPQETREWLDALSAAQHDPVVARAIAPRQREFTAELRALVLGIRDQGWLPKDFDVEAFLMVMMALPFGLVFTVAGIIEWYLKHR